MPHKVSGPHIEKFYPGSSKRLKFLTIVLKNTLPPHFIQDKCWSTTPAHACSKLKLCWGHLFSFQKIFRQKEYGQWKRAVALVVNPPGYTTLWWSDSGEWTSSWCCQKHSKKLVKIIARPGPVLQVWSPRCTGYFHLKPKEGTILGTSSDLQNWWVKW